MLQGMDQADQLLSMFQEQKEEAFKLLYDCYYQDLCLFADHLINNSGDAHDLVQEFFIDFWVNKRYNNITGKLEPYIFQSIRYAASRYNRNTMKKQEFYQSIKEEDLQEPILPDHSESEVIEKLYAAIHRLPEERRKIFLMICVKGMTYKEVANSLHISTNTVKTQMTRSIKFLREALDSQSFELILLLLLKKT